MTRWRGSATRPDRLTESGKRVVTAALAQIEALVAEAATAHFADR